MAYDDFQYMQHVDPIVPPSAPPSLWSPVFVDQFPARPPNQPGWYAFVVDTSQILPPPPEPMLGQSQPAFQPRPGDQTGWVAWTTQIISTPPPTQPPTSQVQPAFQPRPGDQTGWLAAPTFVPPVVPAPTMGFATFPDGQVRVRAVDPGWKTDPIIIFASPPQPDMNARGHFGGDWPDDWWIVDQAERDYHAMLIQDDEIVLAAVRLILARRRAA